MTRKEQFLTTIKENERLIYKITGLYINHVEDREDLYQEIIYQLWKSFESFRGQSKISTWIYRIALNTSIHFLKEKKRKVNTVPLETEIIITGEDNQNEENRINSLYTQIQNLNLIDKGIILLYLDGKTPDEISVITGLSKTNVGTKLSRIKEKLKTNKTYLDYGKLDKRLANFECQNRKTAKEH